MFLTFCFVFVPRYKDIGNHSMLTSVPKAEVLLSTGTPSSLNGKKSLCFSLDRFPFWKHVLKLSLKLCNNAISAVSLFCVGYVFLNNYCRFPGLGALSVVVKSAVARRCLGEPTSMFAMYQNNSMQHRKGRMVQRLKDYSAIVCIVENK